MQANFWITTVKHISILSIIDPHFRKVSGLEVLTRTKSYLLCYICFIRVSFYAHLTSKIENLTYFYKFNLDVYNTIFIMYFILYPW